MDDSNEDRVIVPRPVHGRRDDDTPSFLDMRSCRDVIPPRVPIKEAQHGHDDSASRPVKTGR
jgi:hypothetical protein